MASGKIRMIDNSIIDSLNKMVDRAGKLDGYLNRVVYPSYQNAQRARWITENATEGGVWPALNEVYAKVKLKKFAEYDGGGRKMLIATGKLYKAVIGPGEGHKKLVENRKLTIAWTPVDKRGREYAEYVNEKRNFNKFSLATLKPWYDGAIKYIMRGE